LGHRLSLLGYISDLIGRRRPVLMGGALVMLAAPLSAVYPKAEFPRYSMPLALGIGSGAAIINPPLQPRLHGSQAGNSHQTVR